MEQNYQYEELSSQNLSQRKYRTQRGLAQGGCAETIVPPIGAAIGFIVNHVANSIANSRLIAAKETAISGMLDHEQAFEASRNMADTQHLVDSLSVPQDIITVGLGAGLVVLRALACRQSLRKLSPNSEGFERVKWTIGRIADLVVGGSMFFSPAIILKVIETAGSVSEAQYAILALGLVGTADSIIKLKRGFTRLPLPKREHTAEVDLNFQQEMEITLRKNSRAHDLEKARLEVREVLKNERPPMAPPDRERVRDFSERMRSEKPLDPPKAASVLSELRRDLRKRATGW